MFPSTPLHRIRSVCSARAASGHVAAPPSSVMNSRRFIPQLMEPRLSRLMMWNRFVFA
jgi:hypothetical protein